MDSDDICVDPHTATDKGKQRAATPEPSEQTPLLPSSSSHAIYQSRFRLPPPEQPPHQNLLRRLLLVFLATLLASIVVLALTILFALSYSSRISSLTVQDVLDRGLIIEGPDRIDVLNATREGGVWIRVDGRVGLNVGNVLQIRPDGEDLVWTELWKGIGRWGVRTIGVISVELSQITMFSRSKPSSTLGVLTAPTIELPLSPDPPSGLGWLTPMSIPINIRPTELTEDLMHFANETWLSGTIQLSNIIPSVRVVGGRIGDRNWRGGFTMERTGVSAPLSVKIPQLPGLPESGKNVPFPPFSQLVTLTSFRIFSGLDQLLVNASATFSTPLPTPVELTVPSLPFVISVPRHQHSVSAEVLFPVMHVRTDPLVLTYPNTTIRVHGHAAPFARNSFPSLSSFLTLYLNGESPVISLSTPLLPGATLDTVFPGPSPRPQVLRNVTIKDMKIRPLTSGTMLASGTVFANVVLPKGMDVSLQVNAVYPQLLVYDGPVPDEESIQEEGSLPEHEGDSLPDPMPLPNPLPANAFAHIRPEEWVESVSTPLDHGDVEGSIFAVSAKIVDVPLKVLPGRQREFRNFVGKVIFGGSNGTLAGISGIAAVRISVVGLGTEEIELEGLPLCGDVRIGKKAITDIKNTWMDVL